MNREVHAGDGEGGNQATRATEHVGFTEMSDDKEAIDRLGGVFLDSYFVVNKELRIHAFNAGFPQLLGMRNPDKRKLSGAFCHDLLKLEICRERCIAIDAMTRGTAVRLDEIRGERPDGTPLMLQISAVPLKNAKGEIEGACVTHRDVTDERRLKDRYLEEQDRHQKERSNLLRIIEERDLEIERLQAAPEDKRKR